MLGLKAVWISREGGIMGNHGYEAEEPDWTFGSMKEFAAVMEEVHAGL